MQAGDFEWARDGSETANQVVPPNALLRAYKEEIHDTHSTSAISETGNHVYDDKGHEPPNSLNSKTLSTTAKVAPYEISSQERDSALLRYKEKKRTRRYRHVNLSLDFCFRKNDKKQNHL